MDIQELARLYRETGKCFGEVKVSDSTEFEKAIEEYCESHPHLAEAYPHKELQREKVMLVVRAIARRQLLDEPDKGSG